MSYCVCEFFLFLIQQFQILVYKFFDLWTSPRNALTDDYDENQEVWSKFCFSNLDIIKTGYVNQKIHRHFNLTVRNLKWTLLIAIHHSTLFNLLYLMLLIFTAKFVFIANTSLRPDTFCYIRFCVRLWLLWHTYLICIDQFDRLSFKAISFVFHLLWLTQS